MKIIRDLVILIGIFAGIWLSISYYFSENIAGTGDVLNAQQKNKIADYLDEQFMEGKKIYHNAIVDSAVLVVFDRLKKNSDDTIPYQITLLQSDEVNAFATLDGRIYIFTGLIKKCESPEMLATVLAHEMGHIHKEHLLQRLKSELGINLLIAILTGGDPVMASELGKTAIQMHFNREQEREADDYGRTLLVKSGIDPIYFAQFMMIIKRQEYNSAMVDFLMTHPDTEERIIATTEFIRPEEFKAKKYHIDWGAVLASLEPSGL